MRSDDGDRLVEDCQVELPESLRVGEEVELDDLAVPHRDGADRERLPVAEGDGPGNAVDQRRPYVQPDLGVAERPARDRRGAAHLPRAASDEATAASASDEHRLSGGA